MNVMKRDGIVIDFATRKIVPSCSTDPRTVANLARTLCRRAVLADTRTEQLPPLRIRLADLTGVSDLTISRLTALAATGTLSAASAARLALRHAQQIPGRGGLSDHGAIHGSDRMELTVTGDVFGAFALRIESAGIGTWVGMAPGRCLDRLFEACPESGRGICLLVGRSMHRSMTVRLLSGIEWRRMLVSRARRPEWRPVQHVLVVGGLPNAAHAHVIMFRTIEQAVGWRRESVRTENSQQGRRTRTVPARSPLEMQVLRLIELALPGVVDIESPGERS